MTYFENFVKSTRKKWDKLQAGRKATYTLIAILVLCATAFSVLIANPALLFYVVLPSILLCAVGIILRIVWMIIRELYE